MRGGTIDKEDILESPGYYKEKVYHHLETVTKQWFFGSK